MNRILITGVTLFVIFGLFGRVHADVINSVSIDSVSSELTEGPFLRFAEHLIDGSGKNPNGPGTHRNGSPESYGGTMWLSNGVGFSMVSDDPDPYVIFDLSDRYNLNSVTVWNYNEGGRWTPRGVKDMEIHISTDGGNSFSLFSTITSLEIGPANDTNPFSESFDLSGANGVTHVMFDVRSNHRGTIFPLQGACTETGVDSCHVGLSEVEFEGEPVPKLTCDGFQPPLRDGPVRVNKPNRALPHKAQLFDEEGMLVTGLDLQYAPVVQVLFTPLNGNGIDPMDVSSEALAVGLGTSGNQFVFTEDLLWQFNLKLKDFSASGLYEVSMESGDLGEYEIAPTCKASFVIE